MEASVVSCLVSNSSHHYLVENMEKKLKNSNKLFCLRLPGILYSPISPRLAFNNSLIILAQFLPPCWYLMSLLQYSHPICLVGPASLWVPGDLTDPQCLIGWPTLPDYLGLKSFLGHGTFSTKTRKTHLVTLNSSSDRFKKSYFSLFLVIEMRAMFFMDLYILDASHITGIFMHIASEQE